MSNDSNERGHDTAAQAFQVGDTVRWTVERMPDDDTLTTYEGEVREVDSSIVGVWVWDEGALHFVRPEMLTLISRAPEPASAPAQTVDPLAYLDTPLTAEDRIRGGLGVCEDCGNYGPDVLMRSPIDPADGERMALCQSCWDAYAAQYAADLASNEAAMRDTEPASAPAQTAADEPDMPPSLTMGYDDRDDQDDDDDDPDGDEDWDDDATEPATPAPAATPPALDLGRLEYNIRLASQAIHDAGALSTDQTENIVCVALNQIDVALHTLYDAVRALAAQQQSGK